MHPLVALFLVLAVILVLWVASALSRARAAAAARPPGRLSSPWATTAASPPAPLSSPQIAIAPAGNEFALDLYRRLRTQPGNLCFSPLSVSLALGMAWAGADGETAGQMAGVLHLAGIDPARAQEDFGALAADLLRPRPQGASLRLVDRLWIQQGFDLRPSYVDLSSRTYGAEPGRLDFARAGEAAAAINRWVGEQTDGQITGLVSAGALDRDTRVVLVNALHLVANWEKEFLPKHTRPLPFVGPGGERPVPMMYQRAVVPYLDAPHLQLLVLPYKDEDLQMAFLLPRRLDGLAELESRLDAGQLHRWLAAAKTRPVDVILPRFTIRLHASLTEPLAALGTPAAFGAGADFIRMSDQPLWIGDVLHKAYVKVDEKGTEAAASTAVWKVMGVPPGGDRKPVVFYACHPFLFLIRDARSGAILFLGRVEEPDKGV